MHWSLSLHAQGAGGLPRAGFLQSSGTLNNQSPAEHLLKIRKSLSKRIFVAQNCPFLLLLALFLPTK